MDFSQMSDDELRRLAGVEVAQRNFSAMSDDELRALAYRAPAPPPGVTIHTGKGDVFINDKGQQVPATPAETQARGLRQRDGVGGDVADSVLRGVPYVGEMFPRARAGFNAALPEGMGGNGGSYAENLTAEQARAKTFDSDHFGKSLAGKATGGVLGTVASLPAMAQTGAVGTIARALMGGGGTGAVNSMVRGGFAGGAQGVAQGIGQSEDLTNVKDVAKNAAWGGAFGLGLGAAIPGAIAGAVGTKNWVQGLQRDGLSSTSKEARQFLQQQFSDPAKVAAARTAMREVGPDAILADASQEMLGVARGASAMPGTRSAVIDPLSARDAGKNARMGTALDTELGPAPIPSRVDAGIRDGMEALGPHYGDVMSRAGAVDTQALANTLDASVANLRGPAQQAVQRVRGYLNIPGTNHLDPSPNALFATRQAIDGVLATEQNPQAIRQLTMARQQVDAELARAAPGIKDVDANFQQLAQQREALQRGGQVLDGGKTATRPQELAQEITQGAQPNGTLVGPSAAPVRLRDGARAELDRIVGTNSNDVAKLNQVLKGEGDWNRDKLRLLFGEDRADRVLRVLDGERRMEATNRYVSGNSATEPTKRFADFIEKSGKPSTIPTDSTVAGATARGAQKLVSVLLQNRGEEHAGKVAQDLVRVAMANDQNVEPILRALMTRAQRQQTSAAANEAAGKFAPSVSPLIEALMGGYDGRGRRVSQSK